MKQKGFFDLGNLYVAYRKAKADAFYENTHFHALAYTQYEQNLDRNIKKLQKRLLDTSPNWQFDPIFIGDYAYMPNQGVRVLEID